MIPKLTAVIAMGAHVNGLLALGLPRWAQAGDAGAAKFAVDYWHALTVLESLAWLVHTAGGAWAVWRNF